MKLLVDESSITNLTSDVNNLKSYDLQNTTNITNINSLTTTTLILDATTITATGTQINYLSGVTPGTATASKALVLVAELQDGLRKPY